MFGTVVEFTFIPAGNPVLNYPTRFKRDILITENVLGNLAQLRRGDVLGSGPTDAGTVLSITLIDEVSAKISVIGIYGTDPFTDTTVVGTPAGLAFTVGAEEGSYSNVGLPGKYVSVVNAGSTFPPDDTNPGILVGAGGSNGLAPTSAVLGGREYSITVGKPDDFVVLATAAIPFTVRLMN
jgi:hypothetical protein